MTPSPIEFILKEGKGQYLDDQVEINSSRSKIQEPLIENKATCRGLGIGLYQAQEAGVDLFPTLSESLSTTKMVDATHRAKDTKTQNNN